MTADERKKVPAYVLVGFLGSGKTTLLGRLIGWCIANDMKPGLILNEMGSAWIDAEAMRREGLELAELAEGCICCSSQDELGPALTTMAENPKIDLILLEASGLADPADMLDLLTDPGLWQVVEVGGIISVVDSARWETLSAETKLAQRQVQYADVLLMNKCDLLNRDERIALQEKLQTIAPRARIFPAENGLPYAGVEAVLSHSLDVGRKRFQKQQEMLARALKMPISALPLAALPGGDQAAGGHSELSIHVTQFAIDEPVDSVLFENFLKGLPKTIYRAKGFLKVKGSPQLHTFQHMPGFTKVLPIATYRPPALRGVFIGSEIDEVWLALRIKDCQDNSV
jgi:G3E family GTPase